MNAEYLQLISRPDVQEKISTHSKEWHDNDLVLCQERQSAEYITTYEKHLQGCSCEPRWIPQVHDLQNPERGLWGMVDWTKADLFKSLITHRFKLSCGYDFMEEVAANEITLALLKALAHQWGIEVPS